MILEPRAPGRVLLVGAGPGDPELLTVRATRALREADLVLYDALVDPSILSLAPKARRFYVGKRAGRTAIAQSTIHALLRRAARRGQTVVRLKSGDPFVFGRGGEEAIFCRETGIECEVIPGVTSAIAGPASCGIPVSHRGVSPGFLVLSAVPAAHYQAILPRLVPGSVTVVLMMALGDRAAIAKFLMEASWPGGLPAAIVVGATSRDQWSWSGTLEEMPSAVVPESRQGLPGLLVLGPVVSLGEAIRSATRRDESAERSLQTHPNEEETPWQRMQAP